MGIFSDTLEKIEVRDDMWYVINIVVSESEALRVLSILNNLEPGELL